MAKKSKADESGDGRFAYAGLDRVLHERARLGVLTALMANRKGLTWNELKVLCSLTDGNLSRHLGMLEHEALLEQEKSEGGSRPKTVVRVTHAGRRRYAEYLEALEQVVQDAAAAVQGKKLS